MTLRLNREVVQKRPIFRNSAPQSRASRYVVTSLSIRVDRDEQRPAIEAKPLISSVFQPWPRPAGMVRQLLCPGKEMISPEELRRCES